MFIQLTTKETSEDSIKPLIFKNIMDKRLYIDYIKVHQQLTTDTDEVYDSYLQFINDLSKKGYVIIASTEFGDKTQQIEIFIDNNEKIGERKIE
jgi:hypothetical protein